MSEQNYSYTTLLDVDGDKEEIEIEIDIRESPSDSRLSIFLSKFYDYFTSTLLFLLPSFISPFFSKSESKEAKKLHPTAWLDGLRGIACTVVVIHHFIYSYTPTIDYAYDGLNYTSFLQLPPIKFLHHGSAQVKIFFIISGFALTAKAVKITSAVVKTGTFEQAALLKNLASSVFKRYLRLYLPCAASFVISALVVGNGLLEVLPLNTHPGWVTGSIERRPPMQKSLFAQFKYAFWDFWRFGIEVTFFNGSNTSYMADNHLWTIPVEYRSSISLFILVAGTCNLKRPLRVYLILPFLTFFLLYNHSWGLALFTFGYFLGELHSSLLSQSPPLLSPSKPNPHALLYKALHITMFITGLYLFCYPRVAEATPPPTGYKSLMFLAPPKYIKSKKYDKTHDFWQSLGSMILVWSLLYLPSIQKTILENKVIQYFGRISFSLYVMHGHVHKSWGHYIIKHLLTFTGFWAFDETKKEWGMTETASLSHGLVIFWGLCMTMPVTVWLADVFYRAVDLQSVRFLRWLEGKCNLS